MDIKIIESIIKGLPTKEVVLIDEDAFQSAVMIPIVEKEGELFILFEKRSEKVSQPGEICFPGGGYDVLDINFETTAIREMVEELGIDEEKLMVLGKLGVLASSYRSIIHCYVGLIKWEDMEKARYNQEEVAEIMLINLNTLKNTPLETYSVRVKAYGYEEDEENTTLFPAKALELPTYYHDEWSMGYRKIYIYNLENVQIWGLTGHLLKFFMERLLDNK